MTGLYVLTADPHGFADSVASALREAGGSVVVLSRHQLADAELMGAAVQAARADHGPVTGVMHLSGVNPGRVAETLSDWRQHTAVHCKSLFYLLKLCAEELQESRGRVLAVTAMGGRFGRHGLAADQCPSVGGSAGLVKTLMTEWEGVRGCAVDLDASACSGDGADLLLREIAADVTDAEVSYVDGRRLVWDARECPVDAEGGAQSLVDSDSVVFCVGGAHGITSDVVGSLLQPGVRLILVGRTPLVDEDASTRNVPDEAGLRDIFIEKVRAAGATLTPVLIQREVDTVLKQREIRARLESFRSAGAKVEYLSCDVRDEAELHALVEGVYARHGRIDVVIQGAGIIEDKLIVDKTAASFDRVFDTKADSIFLLSRCIRPEGLRLVILFSSVAGRTGNRGQADYAAANEVLNRYGWWMQSQWPDVKVSAVNWGPWALTGMASEEVQKQFRARGVIPIPPDAGCAFMTNELSLATDGEVEVIAGYFAQLRAREESAVFHKA